MTQRTNEQLLDALTQLFNDLEIESDEEAEQILREAGHEPNDVKKRARSLVDNALAKAKLRRNVEI